MLFKVLVLAIVWSMLCGCILGKECTNTPSALSSHTIRYDLLTSKNETWKKEMFSHYHLTPTDESAWANLLPRKILREEDEFDWVMMYRKMKNSGRFKVGGDFLNEVPLHNVRLDPNSIHGQAQQTNLEYLLMLDVDSLVWSFRKTAGLPTPGKAYGGWEEPNGELRGHFVGSFDSLTLFNYYIVAHVNIIMCFIYFMLISFFKIWANIYLGKSPTVNFNVPCLGMF